MILSRNIPNPRVTRKSGENRSSTVMASTAATRKCSHPSPVIQNYQDPPKSKDFLKKMELHPMILGPQNLLDYSGHQIGRVPPRLQDYLVHLKGKDLPRLQGHLRLLDYPGCRDQPKSMG
jgi:hypothetical protein